MRSIGTFNMRIYPATDKKKLKDGIKKYALGMVSIRSTELANFVGRDVKVVVYLDEPKSKKAKP